MAQQHALPAAVDGAGEQFNYMDDNILVDTEKILSTISLKTNQPIFWMINLSNMSQIN